MSLFYAAAQFTLHLSQGATDVHRGAVLPEARFIVIAVPLTLLCLYFFVARRRRDR